MHTAYLAHHNTTTAVIQKHDDWVSSVDAGRLIVTGVCMLDLRAAFNMADHGILQKNLSLCGFDNTSLDWSSSYLGNMYQCLVIEGSQ